MRDDIPGHPTPSDSGRDARSRWLTALARSARAATAQTGQEAASEYRSRRSGPTLFSPWRRENEPVSLFGEILDWMLAPLLLAWPLSVTITYLVARSAANLPFDQALTTSINVVASQIKADPSHSSGLRLDMPIAIEDLLHTNANEAVSYMVLGLRGEYFAGDRELPLPSDEEAAPVGTTRLRTDFLRGQEIRLAYGWRQIVDAPGVQPVLIQIAETPERRNRLADEIIKGVIAPQFIVMPLTVLLVWFGLSRGVASLTTLQARIRARRPDDVSAIDERAAPEEIAPLVGAFNDMLDRQRQNLRTQRRFLADAAHQMKTPLAGLRTQAELAVRETDPHQLQRSLRQIASSSERAAHLVNQLLALARAEHQATDPSAFEPVDLTQLAREQVRDWVPQALARGIDLGFEEGNDVGAGGPFASDGSANSHRIPQILGVPIMLREMLNNVIDNALRYTPASTESPGAITVRVRTAEPGVGSTDIRVLLEIEDTGPGIPEAERHLVFDRFYRVLGTHADGSGLGLAIVREIVAQHDALIRISANPHLPASAATPGTQISIEFSHVVSEPPTVRLD